MSYPPQGAAAVAALPANTLTVSAVGPADYATVAAALAASAAGDVILIFPGTYAESNLTLVAGVDLVGTDPDQCIIEVLDGVNPIVNSGVTCTISNLKISNLSNAQPGISVTANILTLRNCLVDGTGAGDCIHMTGGTLNIYDSTTAPGGNGDIHLSTNACTLNMHNCTIIDDLYCDADASAHQIDLSYCKFDWVDVYSEATGATNITLSYCSAIWTIYNDGTGTFTVDHCYIDNNVVNNSTGTYNIYHSYIDDQLWNVSTGTCNLYKTDVMVAIWNASTGDVYCWHCSISDIQNDVAGGSVECRGGWVRCAVTSTGPNLWFIEDAVLQVIDGHGDMLERAVEAGAGLFINVPVGQYAVAASLTMPNNCTIVGEGNPEDVVIVINSAVNPAVISNVSCGLQNVTVRNVNAGAPALRVTGNTCDLRNCIIEGTGAGDALQMTAGTLNVYESTIGPGDIDLSTAICTLNMYHSRLNTDPIDTAGAFAHVLTLEKCDLGGQNLASAATGATTLAMRGCTNVGTVSNLGTGTFTIHQSLLAGVTVNNAAAIIRLRACEYRVITRTSGNIVDESMSLIDGLFKVIHKVWEALTATVYNSRTVGAGAVDLGGAGQVRLRITNAAADIAGLESAADAAGALASSLTPARTIRYVQKFSASAFAGANGCRHFFGLRATLGGAFPVAAEQHAGFIWDGTNFYASSSDGVDQTMNLATPSTGVQHTLEVIVFGGVMAEFYVDGAWAATHTLRYPAAAMYWQELVHGSGTGAASACDTTLRRGRVQECPS